jgi:signal transduction histidine kinase
VLLPCLLWVLTTASIYTFRGIRNNIATTYFLIIAIAALLLGGRAAVTFGLLSMLAALAVYHAEIGGTIVFPMPASVEVVDWTLLCVVLGLGTLLLRFAVRGITQGFTHARRNAEELAERNRELQASRDALARQARELALLNDIGGKIAAVLELQSVLDRAVRLVQESFGYLHVAIFTLDREQDALVMKARAGDFAHLFPPDHRLGLGQGIVGWVGRYGERLLANDVDAEPHYVNLYPDVIPTRSELSVPIKVSQENVGVLDVQSPQLDAFDENDVMVMEILADQIAVAIENARLYEAIQQELTKRKRADERLARQAQELARSNTELEQFAYVVSHDLQEPLRMVESYLQLLERRYKGQLDEDADDFITFAVGGAARMQTLIDSLLTYSRVTTRGKPFKPTDCSAVLNHVLANLKVAIEESSVVMTYDDLPTVVADDVQLTQLFQNLIGNAIKFRKPEIRPEIHVGVGRTDGEWVFSVRDNGIGIDLQHFERIFLVFQRLHAREEYEGTGIGLAVCKRIVERHGGRIWVESEPRKGSTFYFTVPDPGGNSSRTARGSENPSRGSGSSS